MTKTKSSKKTKFTFLDFAKKGKMYQKELHCNVTVGNNIKN